MIVNPFSYLIEKLKGKVDKSGDTMTGQLRIDNNDNTPLVIKKTNASIGKVYLRFENSAETIGYFSVGADKNPYFTSGEGTDTQIALMSDLALTDLTITLNTNILYDNNTKVYGVKFGNIAIITGILMVKGAVSRDDVLFTISGFTPTQLTYCTATKTTANKSFLMRFDANGTQAVVDETPTTATANWDFFGFNIVMYHK